MNASCDTAAALLEAVIVALVAVVVMLAVGVVALVWPYRWWRR